MAPRIVSVKATCELGCRLDLYYIAKRSYNTVYDPKKSQRVVMEMKNPRCTASIFTSGKLVVTGARNEEISKVAARKFARIIQKLGFPVKVLNFRITKISAICTAPFRLPLFDKIFLRAERMKSVIYDPELFPDRIFCRTADGYFVLFKSGEVVLTAKTEQQLNIVYSVLEDSFVNKDSVPVKK